jgi:surfactin synthase thioesterase subunit
LLLLLLLLLQDECRGWDISDVVFSAAMWGMYQPMLRADFKLFDEYTPSSSSSSSSSSHHGKCNACSDNSREDAAAAAAATSTSMAGATSMSPQQRPFGFPMRLFWGDQDRRVTQGMVQV